MMICGQKSIDRSRSMPPPAQWTAVRMIPITIWPLDSLTYIACVAIRSWLEMSKWLRMYSFFLIKVMMIHRIGNLIHTEATHLSLLMTANEKPSVVTCSVATKPGSIVRCCEKFLLACIKSHSLWKSTKLTISSANWACVQSRNTKIATVLALAPKTLGLHSNHRLRHLQNSLRLVQNLIATKLGLEGIPFHFDWKGIYPQFQF